MKDYEITDKEGYAKQGLENYVKDWKIFIDTCSILHPAAEKFWVHVIPYLDEYKNKIIIPFRSVEELEKHAKNTERPKLAEDAKNSLKKVKQLVAAGYVEIRGEKTDNFADNVFQVVFTKFRLNHKMLLITQDNGLARDIYALNGSKSVKAYPVHVKQINQYGYLSNFQWGDENGHAEKNELRRSTGAAASKPSTAPKSAPKSVTVTETEADIDDDDAFEVCTAVTKISDAPLGVSHVPKENETVYAGSAPVKLMRALAAGGEGVIYQTNTPYVAKIYKKEKLTKRRYEKIKRMLSHSFSCEGICYPIAALYNSKKEFVGYLMPKAKGKELQKSIFIKPLFLKNFPNWKKRDTVELCITILKKIQYLHDKNIIMGDINPSNILVVSPKEVYFVDTDSYQIEDFPCPVGTVNYTAPEIQRKHFANFLRTEGNENFAVATLLFMIMLPGKPPYSQQGGEDPIDNIIKMDFSYPFGDNTNRKTPDGPWRYIWSHLTYDLKKAFYNTFRGDGEHASESTRLSADEWLPIFTYYLELLDSGKFGKQDPMSEELFPTRHKKNPKAEYVTCKLCGNEVEEHQCQNGICRPCLNRGEVYRCARCGREIMYTNYQKYIKNAKKHDVCPECFRYRREIRMRPTCIDCGTQFAISNSEYEFLKSKGFEVPKRCKACRERKKNQSQTPIPLPFHRPTMTRVPTVPSRPTPTPTPKPKPKGGTFCFITTAVCEYYGKDDRCAELNALRNFRDTWLTHQPDGPALIAEYYRSAPLLVSKMKQSEHFGAYCQTLWEDYLKPCLAYIRENAYEACKQRYIDMVHYMESEFKTKTI